MIDTRRLEDGQVAENICSAFRGLSLHTEWRITVIAVETKTK